MQNSSFCRLTARDLFLADGCIVRWCDNIPCPISKILQYQIIAAKFSIYIFLIKHCKWDNVSIWYVKLTFCVSVRKITFTIPCGVPVNLKFLSQCFKTNYHIYCVHFMSSKLIKLTNTNVKGEKVTQTCWGITLATARRTDQSVIWRNIFYYMDKDIWQIKKVFRFSLKVCV
jgi:hypothetical protein